MFDLRSIRFTLVASFFGDRSETLSKLLRNSSVWTAIDYLIHDQPARKCILSIFNRSLNCHRPFITLYTIK